MDLKESVRPTAKRIIKALLVPFIIGLFFQLISSIATDTPKWSYYFPLGIIKTSCGMMQCNDLGFNPTNLIINLVIITIIYTTTPITNPNRQKPKT